MTDPNNPDSREFADEAEQDEHFAEDIDSVMAESSSDSSFDNEPAPQEPVDEQVPDPHDYDDEDLADEFRADHTSLKCFSLIARHHGVDVSADRLIHDYSLENEEPSLKRLLRIIKDSG